MKIGFRLRLFLLTLGILTACFLGADLYLGNALDAQLTARAREDASVRLELATRSVSVKLAEPTTNPRDDLASWDRLADDLGRRSHARVSVIRPDGMLLGDSEIAAAALASAPNHGDRPEVRGAIAGGRGSDVRESETVHRRFSYVADPVRRDGAVVAIVRIATPLDEVDAAVRRVHQTLLVATGVAYALGIVLSGAMAHGMGAIVSMLMRAARRDVLGERLAAARDATDVRRLETMRRDFVANVSHELRTPVTAVRSAAETLQAGAADDPHARKKFIDVIARNAERLQRLIEDLLDLSKIESKRLSLEAVPVDLVLAANHAVALAAERAQDRGVRLVASFEDSGPALGDRRAIDQILANLLENAVKYCPGATVTVETRARSEHVALAVRDTGPGIAEEHVPRLFERFYRVDAGRSRELGGTGLGLAIVKHLAEAMGGSVSVESSLGQGTTFTVSLPAATGARAA